MTDKPLSSEQGVATEFYLDRPPVPLFQPLMPSKQNCKATQIFEGDHELFDFNKEVEPMLNVLVEKSLEQAQMEVLEEHELAIIKQQAEEYQQIRNAELIEAQRFEAAEQRVAEEIFRRRTQQRARKEERYHAHMKHVCRRMGKDLMQGMREKAISQLHAMKLLSKPIEEQLHAKVLPWLFEKVDMFEQIDQDCHSHTFDVVEQGIHKV